MESQLKIKLVTRYKSRRRHEEDTLIHEEDTLIHEEREDGTMVRKWENSEGEITGEYRLDGTMKLEEMRDDIFKCFRMTGCSDYGVCRALGGCLDCDVDRPEPEIFPIIYETKLPFVKEVRCYDTGRVCTGVFEMLESSTVVEMVPKNYYELFSIIGLETDIYERMKQPIKIREYIVYRYPDSVGLTLQIKEDIIFFGYSR